MFDWLVTVAHISDANMADLGPQGSQENIAILQRDSIYKDQFIVTAKDNQAAEVMANDTLTESGEYPVDSEGKDTGWRYCITKMG